MPRSFALVSVVLAGLAWAVPAHAGRNWQDVDFSDAEVVRAIKAGQKALLACQADDGSWAPLHKTKDGKETRGRYPVGRTALAAYALLESGVNPQHPQMVKALKWLSENETDRTYSLGLRCQVWHAANRQTQGKYQRNLQRDTILLVNSSRDGSYGYESEGDRTSSGDNSNSQYGLLGVWGGALGHVEGIPAEYWRLIRHHWLSSQNPDGGWLYRDGGGMHDLRDLNPTEIFGNPRVISAKLRRAEAMLKGIERSLEGELRRSGVKLMSEDELKKKKISRLEEMVDILRQIVSKFQAEADDSKRSDYQRRRSELQAKNVQRKLQQLVELMRERDALEGQEKAIKSMAKQAGRDDKDSATAELLESLQRRLAGLDEKLGPVWDRLGEIEWEINRVDTATRKELLSEQQQLIQQRDQLIQQKLQIVQSEIQRAEKQLAPLRKAYEPYRNVRSKNDPRAKQKSALHKQIEPLENLVKRCRSLEKLYQARVKNPGVSISSRTMTAAGVASLYVCFDNLYAAEFAGCDAQGHHVDLRAIQEGLDWFDRNFERTLNSGRHRYYYLYGIERVGLASGYRYFGRSNWYKLGARQILASDVLRSKGLSKVAGRNGLSGDGNDVCFSLLFLARGRNPVLFNKLQFQGDWNNRPRDLAAITRWISRNFEATVNWQIINTQVPVEQWHDAPLLYLSGSKEPRFTQREMEALRTFVHQGGTILSVTECGGKGFSEGIRKVYEDLFDYEMVPCAPTHPLYRTHYPLSGQPKFYEISNGVRPFVLHTDVDLALAWQTRRAATLPQHYKIAVNLAAYVAGKGSLNGDLRPRGMSHWPEAPAPAAPAAASVKVVRVKHAGNWNPEPLALERLARMVGSRTRLQVNVLEPVSADKLPASGARVALLTGTGELRLSASERSALEKFVKDGGTVFVDAAGGRVDFANSVVALLRSMYGPRGLRPLRAGSELLNLKGFQITSAQYLPETQQRLRMTLPNLKAVEVDGRPGVLFSAEDLTAAMIGIRSHDQNGYAPGTLEKPGTAYQILRNVLLLASGKADQLAPATEAAAK